MLGVGHGFRVVKIGTCMDCPFCYEFLLLWEYDSLFLQFFCDNCKTPLLDILRSDVFYVFHLPDVPLSHLTFPRPVKCSAFLYFMLLHCSIYMIQYAFLYFKPAPVNRF